MMQTTEQLSQRDRGDTDCWACWPLHLALRFFLSASMYSRYLSNMLDLRIIVLHGERSYDFQGRRHPMFVE